MQLKKLTLLILWLLVASLGGRAQDIVTELAQKYAPMSAISVSYRNDEVVFASAQGGVWKLYHCAASNGTWGEAAPVEAINSLLQAGEHIEGTSLTGDGMKLYFAIVNPAAKTGDIYVAYRGATSWERAEKLPEQVNTAALEGSPSVSVDDRSLFFTRPNSKSEQRDMDARFIYISERDEKGAWKPSYKLPKLINTDCEFAPRMMPDGRTLIFSSVREKVKEGDVVKLDPKGGFDLYVATRIAEKIWAEPVHLPSLSSINNDLFAAYDLAGKRMVFSAVVPTKNNAVPTSAVVASMPWEQMPLKPAPIYTLKATAVGIDQKTVKATYSVVDPYTSQLLAAFEPNAANEVFITLPTGRNYRLNVTGPGYSTLDKNIRLKEEQLDETRQETERFSVFNKAKLQLNVFDNTIFEPLSATILVTNAAGATVNVKVDSVALGIYSVELPLGTSYTFMVSKKAFESQAVKLDLSGEVRFAQFERDVELVANTKELELNVTDADSKDGMSVDVEITNLDKNETIYLKAERGSDGRFKVKLREGDRYQVKVKNPKGYAYYTAEVDMASESLNSKLDVALVPLTATTKLALKAITFEKNSAELQSTSFPELARVIELLQQNPELKVEISAHTDEVGSDSYNLSLSDRRAKSVVKYMQDQGVSPESMLAKGYGESKPLVPNINDENRAQNRRVELQILEK